MTKALRRPVVRRAGWGMLDQAMTSLVNFSIGILVTRSTDAGGLGVFGILFAGYVLALGVGRALLAEPFMIRVARPSPGTGPVAGLGVVAAGCALLVLGGGATLTSLVLVWGGGAAAAAAVALIVEGVRPAPWPGLRWAASNRDLGLPFLGELAALQGAGRRAGSARPRPPARGEGAQ
jgi:hypothetical protein